jgi:hypothetical protein
VFSSKQLTLFYGAFARQEPSISSISFVVNALSLLLHRLRAYASQKTDMVMAMESFASSSSQCRRAWLLEYLGEPFDQNQCQVMRNRQYILFCKYFLLVFPSKGPFYHSVVDFSFLIPFFTIYLLLCRGVTSATVAARQPVHPRIPVHGSLL